MRELKQIAQAIDGDLLNGIYDPFPALKNRLLHITEKLYKSAYVLNADPLTEGERKTLIENEYITDENKIL